MNDTIIKNELNINGEDEKKFNTTKLQEVMAMKAQVEQMVEEQKMLQNQIKQNTSDNGFPDYLKEYVLDKTEEEIKALSKEELIKVYENSGEFTIHETDKDNNFLIDYLLFIKESEKQSKEFDELIEKFQTEISDITKEIQEECAKFGDIRGYILDNYKSKLESAEGDEKVRLEGAIESINDSLTLNRIYELYSSLKPENTLNDYKNKDRQKKIIKDYSQAIKTLRLRTNISIFKGLEKKYLDEKYHKYPNLFLFLVMKYLGYSKSTVNRNDEGLFVVSLSMTLQGLYTETLSDENKVMFIANIERILDLFYK